MFNEEDDGSGFSVAMPPSGSNLQSLFGTITPQSVDDNESLKYVPTKPPTKVKHEAQPAESKGTGEGLTLMHACACHTFCHVNGQYVNQGKLGLAVLGNYAKKDYKLLIYASQKKAITNVKITPTFVFQVQKDNYVTFYDDQAQNWSVRFDSEEELLEIGKRVAIAKFNISPTALLSQDVNFQVTQEIQRNDTVEVQFTGYHLDGNTFGKVFDTNEGSRNLLKYKVGKGKVIKGLDIGVVGMKKLSKRIVIIPPDLATETKDIGPRIPPNCALVFILVVTRVKYNNPQHQPDPDTISLGPAENEKHGSSTDGEMSDVPELHNSLSIRTKSISDQLAKPENTKSKLLERMSKMGKSMVPTSVVPSPVSLEDDIDDDEVKKSKEVMAEPVKPQMMPKPASPLSNIQVPMSQPAPIVLQQSTIDPSFYLQQQQQQQQQQMALYRPPQAVQTALFGYPSVPPQMSAQQIPSQQQQPSSITSTEMNLMLTEGKLKHSEIKSDLTRIFDKLDTINSKIGNLENTNKQLQIATMQQQQQPILNQAPEMEASVIMQNVTRIIKENEKLHGECAEKTKKIELLNEKMTDLLTKNQHFFEKSNQLLANQSDSMQNNATQAMVKVSHLEDQNMRLQTELAALRSQLVQANGEKDISSKQESQLTSRINSLSQELLNVKESADTANILAHERDVMITDLQEKLKIGKSEHKQIQLKLTQMVDENSELKSDKESISNTLNDVKRKWKTEKERNDEELEELKTQHEEEMKSLRERYKRSAGKESEKIARVEEELTQQYEEKMRMRIKSLEKVHEEALNMLKEEKQGLEVEIKKLKEKNRDISVEHTKHLREEMDNLREQMASEHSRALKNVTEKNELLLMELETSKRMNESATGNDEYVKLLKDFNVKVKELDELRLKCDNAYDSGLKDGRATVQTISNASYQRGLMEGKADSTNKDGTIGNSAVSKETIANEVKKVMNSVFFKTKVEFQSGTQYDGKHVVSVLLNTIKEITLEMITSGKKEKSVDSGDEMSDDDDDDDEDDDDNDDDNDDEDDEEEEGDEGNNDAEDNDDAEDTDNNNGEFKAKSNNGDDNINKAAVKHEDVIITSKLITKVDTIGEGELSTNHSPLPSNIEETNDVTSVPSDNIIKDGEEHIEPVLENDADNAVLQDIQSDMMESHMQQLESEKQSSETIVQQNGISDTTQHVVSTQSMDEDDTQQGENVLTTVDTDMINNADDDTINTPPLNDPIQTNSLSDPNLLDESRETKVEGNDFLDNQSSISVEDKTTSDLVTAENTESYGTPHPQSNTSSISITGKSSFGDSGDEHYATDEGDDFDEQVVGQTENQVVDLSIRSDGLDVLLIKDVDVTVSDSQQTVSEDPLLTSENPLTSEDSNLFTNVKLPDSQITVSKDDPLLNSEDSNLFTNSDLNKEPAEISSVGEKQTNESSANKRNTLEDLGLDSSIFGVTKQPVTEPSDSKHLDTKSGKDDENVTANDDSSMNDDNTVKKKSASISSTDTLSEVKPKTVSKKSIFDDDGDSDDDLFSSTTVKHKISPFVRSPPPLFDDDDDDVNWI